MTKRYFITDPLQAAMAAEYHGIKLYYEMPFGGGEIKQIPVHNFCSIYYSTINNPSKWYIHPDSEHLLQPQHWDWCEIEYDTYDHIDGNYYNDGTQLGRYQFHKNDKFYNNEDEQYFIQAGSTYNRLYFHSVKERNNKPFPQFESEEV